jgi:monovalent cation/hydrogen antiporter
MIAGVQIAVLLLMVVAAVAWAARRLAMPPAILLVVVGVLLALVPGLPPVELVPELVLLLVLPPLIYSAGVAMSWREFRANVRPIALLAVGCVVFTTVTVAVVAHVLLGLPWPAGFVLGAIVSPPDVVAPLAIARRLGLPRRLLVILEGEGLANDATALVLLRFAVAAASTGALALGPAIGVFAAIFGGEIAYGFAVGWSMLRLRHAAGDPRVEITLSLVTPYVAFWVPEHLGGSGVLATVVCGLYVSWNGPRLIPSATRLQGLFFWDLFTFLIEGTVFVLTGLQARTLLERGAHLSVAEVLGATAAVAAVVIAARFVWVFTATYLPHSLPPRRRRAVAAPSWPTPFMLAFTGVRGIVSLAAALAIPLATADGAPFPQRDLILFVTFGVIVLTLVGQGLLMPVVMERLGLAEVGRAEHRVDQADELAARREAIAGMLRHLDDVATTQGLPARVVEPLRAHHRARLQRLAYRSGDDTEQHRLARVADELELQLIAAERRQLYQLMCEGRVPDEARRRIERDLDLREAQLRSPTG